MRTHRLLVAACVAFAASAGACAPIIQSTVAPVPAVTAAAVQMVADRLFLGREVPDGGSVTDDQWQTFMREAVTARFPDGLTIWRAEGQWREPEGRVAREATFVLEIFHGGTDAEERAIAAIAEEYKRRFRQTAVLRATSTADVRLYE